MNPLTKLQALLYAAPWNAFSFIMLPLGVILPTYYAENTLAGMAAIGLVSGISRLFDAVTDPLIGYLSDRTRSRLGPRKPWIVIGSIITCVAIYFLFQPPPDAGITYYAIGSFALYLGFTLFDIPHKAWYSEVSAGYDDRSRLAAYVGVCTILGSILFWVVPVALSPFTGSMAIGPESLTTIVWLLLIMLPASIVAAVIMVPVGRSLAPQPTNIFDMFRAVRGNKPFLRFLAAASLWGIGQGVSFSVVFIVMRDYLGLGEQFSIMMIFFFLVQFASMPVWAKLMNHFGKHRAWAVSWGFSAIWSLVLLLLEPGSAPFWPALILIVVSAAMNGASYIAPRAVLGDIIDYDILRTRTNNSGKYFAFNTLLDKSLIGIGVAIAFPMLSWFGYNVGGENDATANTGLLLTYLALPLVTHLAAAALLWNFPLDRRRHDIVQRRINQLAERNQIQILT
ncbi:MAG: MFS transporter [Pseudomonadota bacterium]